MIKLKSNETDNEKLNFVLMIGYEVAGNLLNKMWIPKNDIINTVNYYLNNIFFDYYIIGIQLRYDYLNDIKKNFYSILLFKYFE